MGFPMPVVEAGGYVMTLGSVIPWKNFTNDSWVPGELKKNQIYVIRGNDRDLVIFVSSTP